MVRREPVRILGGQYQQPDIVQQGGGEGVGAASGLSGQHRRQARDAGAVPVKLLEIEPGDRPADREHAERLGVQQQGPERLEAEIGDGFGDLGDRGAAAEVGRVGELQHLRRHRDVLLDDPPRVGGAGITGGQQFRQLGVEARDGRQRGRADRTPVVLDTGGERLQRARPLDHPRELGGLARLGDEPVGGGGRARHHPQVGVAREDDPDRGGVPVANHLEQRRAVDARHPQVGDDDIAGRRRPASPARPHRLTRTSSSTRGDGRAAHHADRRAARARRRRTGSASVRSRATSVPLTDSSSVTRRVRRRGCEAARERTRRRGSQGAGSAGR